MIQAANPESDFIAQLNDPGYFFEVDFANLVGVEMNILVQRSILGSAHLLQPRNWISAEVGLTIEE